MRTPEEVEKLLREIREELEGKWPEPRRQSITRRFEMRGYSRERQRRPIQADE